MPSIAVTYFGCPKNAVLHNLTDEGQGAIDGIQWMTIIFDSVISSIAYRGPSLPSPLSFRPP